MPEITQLGLIMFPLCLWFYKNGQKLLSIAIFSTAFGAASVLNLRFGGYGLGILPPYLPGLVFIAFCMLRYLAGHSWGNERSVARAYLPFILFTLYCSIVTVVMPQIMAGRLLVWPQRPDIFHVRVLLHFSTGNISQLSYVLFTAVFCFLATCYVERKPWVAEHLLNVSFLSGYIVVLFGLWQFLSRVSGVWYPDEFLFSNPYATLNSEQAIGTTVRVSGSFTEPAYLASHVCGVVYATFWLILKGDERRTVLLLYVLSTILVLLSTSTTGYILLAAGIPCMMLLSVSSARIQALWRLLKVVFWAGVVITGVIFTVPTISPELAGHAQDVIQATLSKEDSQSYDERTMWDADAVSLVRPTFGFGAGWGSVRSSSLGPAILGGTGIWGFGLFVWFICRATAGVRRTQRQLANFPRQARVLGALSASAVAILLSAAVAGPNLNAMEAWLPLAAALGVVVRMQRTRALAPRLAEGGRLKLTRRHARSLYVVKGLDTPG